MNYIQDAIKNFKRLLVWEKDVTNLARIIIKVRVIDLDQVPKSIKITNEDGFLSECWTVPCEIISQSMLRGGPPDKDDPPTDRGDPHLPPPQNWLQQLPHPTREDPAGGSSTPIQMTINNLTTNTK